MCPRGRSNKQVRCRIGIIGHKKWSEEANHDEEANDCTANRYLAAYRHRSPYDQQHIQETSMQWITGEECNRSNVCGARYFLGLHRYAPLSMRTRGSRKA